MHTPCQLLHLVRCIRQRLLYGLEQRRALFLHSHQIVLTLEPKEACVAVARTSQTAGTSALPTAYGTCVIFGARGRCTVGARKPTLAAACAVCRANATTTADGLALIAGALVSARVAAEAGLTQARASERVAHSVVLARGSTCLLLIARGALESCTALARRVGRRCDTIAPAIATTLDIKAFAR